MSSPRLVHSEPLAFAVYLPREGIRKHRNGQLMIYARHSDAVREAKAAGEGHEIMPLDLKREVSSS